MFFGVLSIIWLRVWFFCFYSFLENHHGGECDCSGRPLPHVLNSCFVSEKDLFNIHNNDNIFGKFTNSLEKNGNFENI